jgi:hypothetical protein
MCGTYRKQIICRNLLPISREIQDGIENRQKANKTHGAALARPGQLTCVNII